MEDLIETEMELEMSASLQEQASELLPEEKQEVWVWEPELVVVETEEE